MITPNPEVTPFLKALRKKYIFLGAYLSQIGLVNNSLNLCVYSASLNKKQCYTPLKN